MKDSTLKEVREEYNRIRKEKETLLSHKHELTELMQNEKVKRFFELSELVDRDYSGPSEETMIMMAYQSVPEAFGKQNINSNHIMVYMGSYIAKNSKKQNNDCITYDGDPDTSYKSYMDLETTEWYCIDKDKCLEFEKEYIALYLPISEYTVKEYSQKYIKLQKWFRTQLINRSQSDVIGELQENYCQSHEESMKGKLYRKEEN